MIDIRDRSQESAMDLIDSCLFDFLSMCRSARASRKYYTYLRMIARDRDFFSLASSVSLVLHIPSVARIGKVKAVLFSPRNACTFQFNIHCIAESPKSGYNRVFLLTRPYWRYRLSLTYVFRFTRNGSRPIDAMGEFPE